MKSIIDGFPKTAHPMGVLHLTSATAFNPKSVNVDNEKKCMKPFVKRWVNFGYCNLDVQKSMGYPLNYYDNTKGYVENFMKLMFELPTEPYKKIQ
jgi:citrate synthase